MKIKINFLSLTAVIKTMCEFMTKNCSNRTIIKSSERNKSRIDYLLVSKEIKKKYLTPVQDYRMDIAKSPMAQLINYWKN